MRRRGRRIFLSVILDKGSKSTLVEANPREKCIQNNGCLWFYWTRRVRIEFKLKVNSNVNDARHVYPAERKTTIPHKFTQKQQVAHCFFANKCGNILFELYRVNKPLLLRSLAVKTDMRSSTQITVKSLAL